MADLHASLGRGVSSSEAKAWVHALDRVGEGLDREKLLEACLVGNILDMIPITRVGFIYTNVCVLYVTMRWRRQLCLAISCAGMLACVSFPSLFNTFGVFFFAHMT